MTENNERYRCISGNGCGQTIIFEVEGLRYPVTDNGPGFQQDSIGSNDGMNDYEVTLFGRDVMITSGPSPNQ